jgi:hypothetical protein
MMRSGDASRLGSPRSVSSRRHHPRRQHPPARRSLRRQLPLPTRRIHRPARQYDEALAPRSLTSSFTGQTSLPAADEGRGLCSAAWRDRRPGHAQGRRRCSSHYPSREHPDQRRRDRHRQHLERDFLDALPRPELARESAALQQIAAEEDALLLYGQTPPSGRRSGFRRTSTTKKSAGAWRPKAAPARAGRRGG